MPDKSYLDIIASDLMTLIQCAATIECDISDLLLNAQDIPDISHTDLSKRFPTSKDKKISALSQLLNKLNVMQKKEFICLGSELIDEVFSLRNRVAHDKVIGIRADHDGYTLQLVRFHPPKNNHKDQTVRRQEWNLKSEEIQGLLERGAEQIAALKILRVEVHKRLEGWPNILFFDQNALLAHIGRKFA